MTLIRFSLRKSMSNSCHFSRQLIAADVICPHAASLFASNFFNYRSIMCAAQLGLCTYCSKNAGGRLPFFIQIKAAMRQEISETTWRPLSSIQEDWGLVLQNTAKWFEQALKVRVCVSLSKSAETLPHLSANIGEKLTWQNNDPHIEMSQRAAVMSIGSSSALHISGSSFCCYLLDNSVVRQKSAYHLIPALDAFWWSCS